MTKVVPQLHKSAMVDQPRLCTLCWKCPVTNGQVIFMHIREMMYQHRSQQGEHSVYSSLPASSYLCDETLEAQAPPAETKVWDRRLELSWRRPFFRLPNSLLCCEHLYFVVVTWHRCILSTSLQNLQLTKLKYSLQMLYL